MTLPWDELNVIRSRIESAEEFTESGVKKYNREKCLDIIFDYLTYAYAMGVDNVNENMSSSFAVQDAEMRSVINRKVAGKDFTERVTEYAEKGDLEAIMRVAEADAHRVLNTASLNTAKKAGARFKTWVTMMDDKVRDTHDYLQAMTVGINDRFVTYDGDSASFPGDFEYAENNVNCRCTLVFA